MNWDRTIHPEPVHYHPYSLAGQIFLQSCIRIYFRGIERKDWEILPNVKLIFAIWFFFVDPISSGNSEPVSRKLSPLLFSSREFWFSDPFSASEPGSRPSFFLQKIIVSWLLFSVQENYGFLWISPRFVIILPR